MPRGDERLLRRDCGHCASAGQLALTANSSPSAASARFPRSGHPLTGQCQGAIPILRNPSVAFTHKSQPPVFLQSLTASVFSLRWLRTESRQSPIRFKHVAMCCDRPGGLGRPRETLVPSRVQGVGHIPVAVAMATPVRNGLTAWAIQSSALHRVAQRRRPIIRVVLHQTASWLTAFGQTIT